MTNNPIVIIKKDHQILVGLFRRYKKLGHGAFVTKRKVVNQIIHELTLHTEMEETLCYPRFKDAIKKKTDQMIEEALVEHAGIETLLEDLKKLEPDEPEFDANVKVLIEQVKHHMTEEEGELLPAAEKGVPKEELALIGEKMIAFKNRD